MIDDELNNPLKQSRKSRKSAKDSIVMDMNAMVDLAFLLLTFFMLTTTMIKPKAIELVMPVPDEDDSEIVEVQKIKESRALTVIPVSNNRVFYYTGFSKAELSETRFGADGIREVLQEHIDAVNEPVVILKPHPDCVFENIIDLIDEMNITKIERYAIDEFSEADKNLFDSKGIQL
jgi:biopolymer transport protein ExbD